MTIIWQTLSEPWTIHISLDKLNLEHHKVFMSDFFETCLILSSCKRASAGHIYRTNNYYLINYKI